MLSLAYDVQTQTTGHFTLRCIAVLIRFSLRLQILATTAGFDVVETYLNSLQKKASSWVMMHHGAEEGTNRIVEIL